MPAVVVVVAGIAYGESVISLTARGVLWVAAVAWAGIGCLINGPILREVPLQNRWNPLSAPQYCRRVERALCHLVRLESVLARVPGDFGRQLCSRMDLERNTSDQLHGQTTMARTDDCYLNR